MKIICIGQNYREHVKELGAETPSQPVFFCKPDTALLLRNRPFYIPDFSNEIHYETELVLRIGKVGKNIEPRYAMSYVDGYTLGFDFTARDLQRKLRAEGLPWEAAKAFDNSAALGEFIPREEWPADPNHLRFELRINGQTAQSGNTADMIFPVEQLISHISRFMTLRQGDCIFTGTPPGVGPISIGMKLEALLENRLILKCPIK